MASPAMNAATEVVGDRWSLLILDALQDGPQRFGDLAAAVGPIAPNVLSARLRTLADHRVVIAEPYQLRPPRMSYDLTETGRQLAPVLLALELWGAARQGSASIPWHSACGTPVELRACCPSCDQILGPSDTGETVSL